MADGHLILRPNHQDKLFENRSNWFQNDSYLMILSLSQAIKLYGMARPNPARLGILSFQ